MFVLASACSGGSPAVGRSTSTPSTSPPSTLSPSATTSPTVSPIVHQLTYVVIETSTQGQYTERVRSFAQISGAGIERTLRLRLTGRRLLHLKRAGQYTIESYRRACSSTCRQLHHPKDTCTTTFAAMGQVIHLEIDVTPGLGCTITLL